MKTPRQKYQNDNHFKTLVDMMVAHIHACNYTPSEMREAAILASIIYNEQNIKQYDILIPKHLEKEMEDIKEWIDEVSQLPPHLRGE